MMSVIGSDQPVKIFPELVKVISTFNVIVMISGYKHGCLQRRQRQNMPTVWARTENLEKTGTGIQAVWARTANLTNAKISRKSNIQEGIARIEYKILSPSTSNDFQFIESMLMDLYIFRHISPSWINLLGHYPFFTPKILL